MRNEKIFELLDTIASTARTANQQRRSLKSGKKFAESVATIEGMETAAKCLGVNIHFEFSADDSEITHVSARGITIAV